MNENLKLFESQHPISFYGSEIEKFFNHLEGQRGFAESCKGIASEGKIVQRWRDLTLINAVGVGPIAHELGLLEKIIGKQLPKDFIENPDEIVKLVDSAKPATPGESKAFLDLALGQTVDKIEEPMILGGEVFSLLEFPSSAQLIQERFSRKKFSSQSPLDLARYEACTNFRF